MENEKLEKVKKAYNSFTWWYDIRGFFILKLAYRDTLMRQIQFFSQNTSGYHLEAAIGTGTLTQMVYLYSVYILRKNKWTGYGFDYSDEMLNGAKKRFKTKEFKIINADVGNLQFQNNEFDTINVANSLHCFPELDLALKELFRVLKPRGHIYINVILHPLGNGVRARVARRVNEWGIRKGILHKPYYQNEIIDAFNKQGFRILSSDRAGNSLNLIAEKP